MKPLFIDTIAGCNRIFAARTFHPMVCLTRPAKAAVPASAMQFGFYTLWLGRCPESAAVALGRRKVDFSDGTLLACRPGETVPQDLCSPVDGSSENRMLGFHPLLVGNGKTGAAIQGRSFFQYAGNEALHLSLRERAVLEREMDGIDEELHWGIDPSSRSMLCLRINLLMCYIDRFYRRQFITRHEADRPLREQVDRRIDDFFRSGKARTSVLPSADSFARESGCSPAYFDDLLRSETGKNTAEYVACRRLRLAETWLAENSMPVDEVAAALGFPSGSAFCSLFRRLTGKAPETCRHPAQ